MSDDAPAARRPRRLVGFLLWVFAVVLALAVLVHQRKTGPTYPLEVSYDLGGAPLEGRLVRSGTTDAPARVDVPALPDGWTGTLHWQRYPTDEPHTETALQTDEEGLYGELPIQPSAGKLTYFLTFHQPGAQAVVRVPAAADDDPILRYKDPVPGWLVLVHVLVMILTFTFAMRALLAAIFARPEVGRVAWTTLGLMAVGGFALGPMLQKYAFGEFWTGWPNGRDLTDNKALIAWLVWAAACVLLTLWKRRRPRLGRAALIVAALVMLAVYLIPHSLRGSELDYRQLDEGVAPADAIKTG